MNKLEKIKIIFIFLFLVLGFIILRFRPKPEIPFYFGIFEPIIFILIAVILSFIFFKFRKFLISFSEKRNLKKNENSKNIFSRIFNFILEKYLNIFIFFISIFKNFDNFISLQFPNFYFKLCLFCNKFWQYEMKLRFLNSRKSEKILGNLIRNIYVIPFWFCFFLDFYFQKWHFIFWAILFYFLCNIFFKLRFYWSEQFFVLIEKGEKEKK